MRKALVGLVCSLALTLLSVDGQGHVVTVNGSAVDWWGSLPTNNNTGHIARYTGNYGEYVWKEVAGDDTSTAFSGSDITEFRVTADATNLYFLVRMSNINDVDGADAPAVQVAIDRNQTSGSGNGFFCDDNLSADYTVALAAVAEWEYLLSANLNSDVVHVYSGTCASRTPAGALAVTIGAGGYIEFSVPWISIGGAPSAPIRFTVLTGITKNNTGFDPTASFDVVSNYGHPATSSNTTNELSDGDNDYYFDLWFHLEADRDPFPPLLISEVDPDPGYADSTREWIEIFNTSNTNLTLTSFRLGDAETTSVAEGMYSFPSGATIPAGNAQVVAVNGTAFYTRFARNAKYETTSTRIEAADMTRDTSWGTGTLSLADTGDQLLLLDARFTILDAVAWGTGTYPGVTAISAPAAGNSLERTRVYRDTDNETTDFGLGIPTPNVPQATCVDAAGAALPTLTPARACSLFGNPCTADTCSASTCVEGAARNCGTDGIACTQDICDGNYGGCFPPEPAGAKPAGCTDATPSDCVDAACNGAGVCNQSYGFEAASYACTDTIANDCWTAGCQGGNSTCVQTGTPAVAKTAGTQCTDATPTDCFDAQCDGSTGCLQATYFELPSVVCRAAVAGGCDITEYCNGAGSCPGDVVQPIGTSCRAAVDVCDAAETCNGSNACPTDAKLGAGTPCTSDGNVCTLDQCNGILNACQHPAGNGGTVCRAAAAGGCDVAETCTGSSTTCPTDAFLPNTTVCRAASANGCDVAENCTGLSATCPTNVFRPNTYVCRTATSGGCDVAELCPGTNDTCPADTYQPNTFVCRSAVAGGCDIAENCTGGGPNCPADVVQPGSTVCRAAAAGGCDIAEYCTGSTNTCPTNIFQTSSYVCRAAAAGGCDVAENCPGGSALCPTDSFRPSSYACRPATANGCDVTEYCPGTNASCPADVFQPSSFVCRAATSGGCDVAENCPGTSDLCPADGFRPNTYTCRPTAAGGCDVAENCPGSGPNCPTDGYQPSSFVCRAAAAGGCDVAENCPGSGVACPTDSFRPSSYVCRGAAGVCDLVENCPGGSAACPGDAKSTAECRALQGECDVAESCDGSGNDCPADAKHTSGFACTADGNPCSLDQCDGASDACQHPAGNTGAVCRAEVAGGCDVQEVCTGSSTVCPPEVVVAFATPCLDEGNACTLDLCDGVNPACQHPAGNSGAMCRPAASICDQAEYCDGSAVCPTDVVLSSSALCRAATGPCDVDDFCDGVNGPCIDSKQPTTLECRATSGVCDPVEFCDGVDNACPTDVKSVDVCRDAVGVCDAPEFCDGNNGDCPTDAKLDRTSTCRDAQGECDRAETCDSVSDDCPVDGKRTDVCRPAIGDCDLAENCDGIGNSCPADQLAPVTTACDDQNPCTGGTHCNGAGICVAETVTCDAGTHDAAADGGTLDAVGVDTARYDASVRRDSANGAAPIDSPDGCGCVATTASRGPLAALLLLGGLLALRRRSNRR